jgi:hypothetical protein
MIDSRSADEGTAGEGARDEAGDAAICSRAGCRNTATTTVNWRNPRIHSPDRVKVWLACDEHSAYLRDYLAARDFPVVLAPLGTPVESVPSPASALS